MYQESGPQLRCNLSFSSRSDTVYLHGRGWSLSVGEPRRGLLIFLPPIQAQTHSNGGTNHNITCTSDVCPREDFSMSVCIICLLKSS
jgi:hypothetical protein